MKSIGRIDHISLFVASSFLVDLVKRILLYPSLIQAKKV